MIISKKIEVDEDEIIKMKRNERINIIETRKKKESEEEGNDEEIKNENDENLNEESGLRDSEMTLLKKK